MHVCVNSTRFSGREVFCATNLLTIESQNEGHLTTGNNLFPIGGIFKLSGKLLFIHQNFQRNSYFMPSVGYSLTMFSSFSKWYSTFTRVPIENPFLIFIQNCGSPKNANFFPLRFLVKSSPRLRFSVQKTKLPAIKNR